MTNETKQKIDDLLENFHTPLYNANKMISFIFGAGINFNIAEGAKTWRDLSLTEAKKAFRGQGKDEFESQALASKLVKKVNNDKLILGLESSVTIAGIKKMSYPTKFATEFACQLSSLMTKFNTYIGTLNYDTVLEEYLLLDGINRLENQDYKLKSKKDVINHFHGMIDNYGALSNKKLLTQNDYIFNSDDASNALANFMDVYEENSGEKIHYVFILGSNVNEDHILKALNLASKRAVNNSVKIIIFNHVSGNEIIENKISSQFKKLGIDFIDFYDTGEISTDFEKLWNYLVKSLNIYSINPGQISNMELVDYMDIARDIIKNKSGGSVLMKDIEQYKFFKENEGTDNLEKYIAKTASYMTFRDNLKKKDFVKYLIEKGIPLSDYKHDLYKTVLSRTDLMNLTKKYENKSLSLISYRNVELSYAIKKTYESKNTFNLKDRPNFMTKLFANGFSNKRDRGHNFKRYVIKNFSVINWKAFNNTLTRADDTPDKLIWLVDLLETSEVKLEGIVDFSKKPSMIIYEKLIRTHSYWTFWLLETNKWKDFASKNFKRIEEMSLKYIDSVEDGDFRYNSFNMFSYLYMKSKNSLYLAAMAKQSTFGEYPTTLNFIGQGGSFTANYSKYDGKHFLGDIKYFKTTTEALALLNSVETVEYSDALRFAQINKGEDQTWMKFVDDVAEIHKLLKEKKYQYSFRKLFKQIFYINDLGLKDYNELSTHIKDIGENSFGMRLFNLEEPKDLETIEDSINKLEWNKFDEIVDKDISNLFLYAEYKTNNTWYADSYLYQIEFMKKLSFLSVNGNLKAKKLIIKIYGEYKFSEGALYLMTEGFKIFVPESVLDLNVILHYFPHMSLAFFSDHDSFFKKISMMKEFDKKNRDFIRFVWNYIYLAANNDWKVYSTLSIKAAKLSEKENEFTNFFWEVHMHNFLQNNERDESSNPPAKRVVWLLRDLKDEEFEKYDDNLSVLVKKMRNETAGPLGSGDVVHLVPLKPYFEKTRFELDEFIFKCLQLLTSEIYIEYYLKSTYKTIIENRFSESLKYFNSKFPELAKKFAKELNSIEK